MYDEMEIEKEAVAAIDKQLAKNPEDPTVFEVLNKYTPAAANILGQLMIQSGNDNVRLAAARDILDRSGYRPVERKDITSGGQPIGQAQVADDKLMEIIDGYLKRNSIDVEAREVGPDESGVRP